MKLNEGFDLESFEASSGGSNGADFSVFFETGDWTAKGKLNVEIKKPIVDYEIGWQWWGIIRIPDMKYIEARLPVVYKYNIDIEYKNDDKNKELIKPSKLLDLPFNKKVDKKRLKMGEVPVASVAGVINGFVSLDLVCEVSGSLEIAWTVETTMVFSLQNNKTGAWVEKRFGYDKVEIKGDFKFGPELTLDFVIGWAGFSIDFLEVKAGVYAKVDASIAGQACTGSRNAILHGGMAIYIDVAFEGNIGLIRVLNLDVKLGLKLEYSLGPWKLVDLHLDFAEKFYPMSSEDKCILKNRPVVFESDGVAIHSSRYDVGARIGPPAEPKKSGYRFAGWYINSSKSGLAGSDCLFDFDRDTMPYISKQGTFYLYAKWTQMGASVAKPPVTQSPVTRPPVTQAPVTRPPVTRPPVTQAPVTQSPVTQAPVTQSPVTQAPVTPEPITPPPTAEPVDVTRIMLNKTSVEEYNDDSSKVMTLIAKVYPSDADDPSVTWESSNPSIVFVNDSGEFSVGRPGTATITCQSVSNPDVTATCVVHVLQHVQQIYIDGERNSLLPGETLQLTADCYPSQADDTSVTWTSSNNSVATVNQNGRVTAVGYGDAVITATTEDGSDLSADFTVHVEHELSLEVSMVNDTAFLQNDDDLCIAYISPTASSMERMAQKGYELQWSVSRKSGSAAAQLNEIDTTIIIDGNALDSSLAALMGTEFPSAGNSTFTVTCNAGPYTASVDVSVLVDGTAYAEKVKLDPSTFYLSMGETAIIPSQLTSADGKPVPSGMSMRIIGDSFYTENATEDDGSNGTQVSFVSAQ